MEKFKLFGLLCFSILVFFVNPVQAIDKEIIENMEAMIEALEFRITGRSNVVQKTEGGTTGWIGGGISLGYEF